jgi:hypothetical protein
MQQQARMETLMFLTDFLGRACIGKVIQFSMLKVFDLCWVSLSALSDFDSVLLLPLLLPSCLAGRSTFMMDIISNPD